MSLWDPMFAAVYDPFLAGGEALGMRRRRADLIAGLSGEVVEIGAGTGLNLAHYPSAVTRLLLTEPDTHMAARLRKRAADRPGAEVVETGGEALPVPDQSVDAVVCTLVLCTAPDPIAVATEVKRVLRPGGTFALIEHVRGHGFTERVQDRIRPAWEAFGGGCRCNQPTRLLLEQAGWSTSALSDARWRGMPPFVAPLLSGHLTRV